MSTLQAITAVMTYLRLVQDEDYTLITEGGRIELHMDERLDLGGLMHLLAERGLDVTLGAHSIITVSQRTTTVTIQGITITYGYHFGMWGWLVMLGDQPCVTESLRGAYYELVSYLRLERRNLKKMACVW